MNRNQYCCQLCGNLKYNWSENLCPKCLEKDRLRRECKKYFGISIKMREATKEEKQGVDEYIQSISEKIYTKKEVIAILKELQLDIEEQKRDESSYQQTWNHPLNVCISIIQQKINSLKENTDGSK